MEFLKDFYFEGWIYFYKFALSILLNLEHRILSMTSLEDIIQLLKFKESNGPKMQKRETIVFEDNEAFSIPT